MGVGVGVNVGVCVGVTGQLYGSKYSQPFESIIFIIRSFVLSNGGGTLNWYGNETPVATK